MTKMIALKPHRYGPKQYKPGDTYEVTKPSDVHLVRVLGWSKEATATTAAATAATTAPGAPKGKGKAYGRRDMVAAPAAPIETVVQTAERAPGGDAGGAASDANTFAEQTPSAKDEPAKGEYTRRGATEAE